MYSDEFRGVTRILVGWTSALSHYLSLAFWMITSSDVAEIHR